ncbi:SIR2 family NAD-dependent protein deacylase [Neisseria wadsworthii]|nr:NAD-dependent deacylase [Neisseria wadsworthii]QMT34692.1 NAD-dependent deacylase [Neisseria wadsworthii]
MKKCIVLTGAGISADSGLKTFRDAGGLWEGYRVEEVCTPEAFARNPQLVLDFYNQRRKQAEQASPNAAHLALAKLEQHYQMQIITQNVDNLHERAGSSHVLHLHGELSKLRSTLDETDIIEWTGDQALSDTNSKGHPLRPHIVWFGEDVPLFPKAVAMMHEADVVLIIGTSLQVYPAASLLHYAPPHADVYLVDPNPQASGAHIEIVPKKAAEGVPPLVDYLIGKAK